MKEWLDKPGMCVECEVVTLYTIGLLLGVKTVSVLVVGDSLVEEKIGGGNIQEVAAQVYRAVLETLKEILG